MTLSWTMLCLQALLAIVGLRLIARWVMPGLAPGAGQFSQPGLVLDVWGPFALMFPMLAFVRGVNYSVARDGWMTIGAPMLCAVLACGMAMTRSAVISSSMNAGHSGAIRVRLASFVVGVGALVLLLGAAHDLTTWIGQVSFAIAAVLLWINTPDHIPSVPATNVENEGKVGGALALVVLCGLGQAAAIWMGGPERRLASAAMFMVWAALILAWTARMAGPAACLRLGGWTAVYGVMFGLGAISLSRLIPNALHAIHDRETHAIVRVAFGFGSLTLEALGLLMCGGIILVGEHLHRIVRFSLGGLLILASMLDVILRIVGIVR